MTWVQWCCSKAWHQTLGQRPHSARCKGAFPGALICFWSSDWSPAPFWPQLSNIRPSFQALFGSRHSQGPFPVGSLETAALFWKVGEFNEWMQAFLCQLASRPANGPAFNFLKETQPQVSLSLPLTSWVVRAWLFTYKNDFVKMERAWKNSFKDYLLWIWFFLT